MIDPLSLFGTILSVVQLIATLASKALGNKSQSKHKCLVLAGRVRDLGRFLQAFPHAAVHDKATAGAQARLKDALDEAFRLIKYCQEGSGRNYCCSKVTELDNVDRVISSCVLDLTFMIQARGYTPAAAVHDDYSSNNQAKLGGASSSSVCVGWPLPLQHTASTSAASPPAPYYQPQHAPPVGWPSPAVFYGCPTAPSPCGNLTQMTHPSAYSSSSAITAFAGPPYHMATSSSGTNLKWREEFDEAMNRAVEESLASSRADEAALNRLRAEEDAALNLVLASSRGDEAALNRLRAGEEAAVNRLRAGEEAAVNRPVEETLAITLAQNEADVIRVVVEDMVRELCAAVNHHDKMHLSP